MNADTDTMYAPATPESAIRAATLFAAKAWRTESLTHAPVAGGHSYDEDTDTNFWTLWVFELTEERWSTGEHKFGREMLVSVDDNGWCVDVTDTEG